MNEDKPQSFGQFLKAYFKNLGKMLTHPWTLIPTLLISAAWIFLGIYQNRVVESLPLSIVNFFTFAQGGLFGGMLGAIGGVVGKILIATLLNALLLPIFMKGARPFARFGRGFKGLFKSFAFTSGRALSTFMMGVSLAMLLYSVLNITQRWQESLVGVAGAILLIKSIGQRGGLLFSFFFSFLSAFTRGRTPSYQGISRLLSGMAVGMTAGTVLNACGYRWALLISACALVVAFLFVWFGGRKRTAMTVAAALALLLVPVYAGNSSLPNHQDQQQMPQEMQELYNRASDYNGINSKVEALERQYEQAAARNDEREMNRIADEIAKIYMGQANDAMELYRMAQEYQNGMGGSGEEPDGGSYGSSDGSEGGGSADDDGGSASDPNPFGVGPGSFFDGWKPGADDDFWGKWLDDETGQEIKKAATEGWDDESSKMTDEDDITMWEGIGAGAAAATAAGAAAGAGGAGGAGGGMPDLPDGGGDWEATEPKEQEEDEEDEDEDEPDEEGGDGDAPEEGEEQPYDPYEGSKVPDNKHVTDNGDGTITMTSPSTGEKITLVPDGNGGWENPLSGAKYDNNDVHEWVRDQEDNAEHWQNQAKTDQEYKEAFEKDAREFSQRSEEERINREVAEDEKKAEEQEMHDRVVNKANEYGVKTTDDKGEERDIKDIKDDTKKAIKKDVYHDTYLNELAIQQICGEVEQECSEEIAKYEMVDNVSEGTVNVLAEYVPGGDKVKDFHTFTKATMVGGMEGYLKEGWSGAGKGAMAGAAEGTVGVLQNHLSDLTKGATGNKMVDELAADVLNVQTEGIKVAIHDLSRGKSIEETYSDVQEATVKKTGDILVGKVLGKGLGMDDHDANAVGELISKGHDDLKWGGGDNPEEDKTISGHIASKWQDLKDGAAEKMYDLYYGN